MSEATTQGEQEPAAEAPAEAEQPAEPSEEIAKLTQELEDAREALRNEQDARD